MNSIKTYLPADARLAAKALRACNQFETGQAILTECADHIEELRAEIKALRVAAFDNAFVEMTSNSNAETKLAKVIAAYRLEAMKRYDYSHEAFDRHIAELTGCSDE